MVSPTAEHSLGHPCHLPGQRVPRTCVVTHRTRPKKGCLVAGHHSGTDKQVMDGWRGEWEDGQTDGWVGGWMDGQAGRYGDGWEEGCMCLLMDGWVSAQAGQEMDEEMVVR